MRCREVGAFVPVVDRPRCEGKSDCLRVCPYGVFELRTLTPAERGALGLLARLKVQLYGGRQAFVPDPTRCHVCRLCVAACPEHAIRLVFVGQRAEGKP